MATASAAPITEIGHSNPGLVPWGSFFDPLEPVPELAWPRSISTLQKMHTDSQLGALERAITLPIRKRRWVLARNDSRDDVLQFFARELGLPVEGKDPGPRPRAKGRFSHARHLRMSLLALRYGHMYFEQVYNYDKTDGLLHLHKLAPRFPSSIQEIRQAPDGGLEFIRQFASSQAPQPGERRSQSSSAMASLPEPIPVDHLVAYVNDQEGNWVGSSIYRDSYRHWLIKDRLLRVDAINNERNGAGIPIGYAPPGASKAQVEEMGRLARSYAAGESAGGGVPNGADIRLKGVEGSLPNTIESIRYQDEQMARSMLAMFLQLGTTAHGSRSLGSSFIDFFGLALDAIADEYTDITNEHVIEDLADWNWGPDEPVPLLKYEAETEGETSVADLVSLINSGAVTLDAELEAWIRGKYDMPEDFVRPTVDLQPKDPGQIDTESASSQSVQAKKVHAAMTVNGRTLRRNPLPNEVHAAIDYSAMDQAYSSAQTSLVSQWNQSVKQAQIAALVAAIESSDSLDQLATIDAPIAGEPELVDAMTSMAVTAGAHAIAEAAAQGATLSAFDVSELTQEFSTRASAQAMLMTRSLAQSAAAKAVAEAGTGLSMTEVATRVQDYLNGLSDSYVSDQIGGVLMHAQNAARRHVFSEISGGKFYASELLDTNTCIPCKDIDGKEYQTIEATTEDYPSGGFHDCLGGLRCRGTIVWVAQTEQTPTT